MTVKRALIYAMFAFAGLALLVQVIIDPSIDNVACACLVFASSLSMLLYLTCTNTLKTQPLSSFAIFGFCVTTQLGALLIQTIAWTALKSSLFDPLYTFGTLAGYQAIAIGVHAAYRFFSVPKPASVHLFRGLLNWAGVYRTPTCSALWFMGFVGLLSYGVYVRESILASPVGKVGLAFNYLAWAPYLIPLYVREAGEGYCSWKLNRILLFVYTGVLGVLGLALNTRGVMFFGVATVGLLYLLAGLRSDEKVRARSLRGIGVAALVILIFSSPISDLVSAMAIARGLGRVPVSVKIEKTLEVWGRPDLIAAYRAVQAAAILRKAYDEHYIENPVLARFVLTKFHDNSLHFASRLTTDDAKQRLQEVSVKFLWAVLPTPLLNVLGVGVAKADLGYSMGDYLPYLSRGDPLGGHRVGSMFGQGIALFGPLFPFVFAGICLGLFGLMDLLTIPRLGGMASVSALGMLQIWTYFMSGLSYEGLHEVFYFLVRTFWQTVLIYVAVLGVARLFSHKERPATPLSVAPGWQRSSALKQETQA